MFELREIIDLLKEKYPHYSIDLLEDVIRSQFKWLLRNTESGNNESVKIMYIGKFLPIKKRYDSNS